MTPMFSVYPEEGVVTQKCIHPKFLYVIYIVSFIVQLRYYDQPNDHWHCSLEKVQRIVIKSKIRRCSIYLVPDTVPTPPDLSLSTELILDSLKTEDAPIHLLLSSSLEMSPSTEPSPATSTSTVDGSSCSSVRSPAADPSPSQKTRSLLAAEPSIDTCCWHFPLTLSVDSVCSIQY